MKPKAKGKRKRKRNKRGRWVLPARFKKSKPYMKDAAMMAIALKLCARKGHVLGVLPTVANQPFFQTPICLHCGCTLEEVRRP